MDIKRRIEVYTAEVLNMIEFLKEIQFANPELSPLSTARAKRIMEGSYPEFSAHLAEAIKSTEESAKAFQKILDGLRSANKSG